MIGDNIRDVRRSRGMTQAELAEASGLSRSYLADAEQGRYSPNVKTLQVIASALGVPTSALIDGVSEAPSVHNKFAARFRLLRIGAGYSSQQSFANDFGVAQTTVANWETGGREPCIDTLIRLAQCFGVNVDYLVGADTVPRTSKVSVRKVV